MPLAPPCKWVTTRLWPVYRKYLRQHWLSHKQRYSLFCYSLHLFLFKEYLMVDIVKKWGKIINYLLRVKTKMKERRERETRKAECTCVEKQTLSMTWLSMPPTQTGARINPCSLCSESVLSKSFIRCRRAKTQPSKTTVSKKFRSEDVGSQCWTFI